jgi:hypothetical protein
MLNKQLIKRMIIPPLVGIWLWYPAIVTGQRTADLPDPAITPSNSEVIIRPGRIILADNHETAEKKD